MTKRIFTLVCAATLLLACGKKNKTTDDDRGDNGGFVRFSVEGKKMHDEYFVAQFTPAGDMFDRDNLQLYNFNPGSTKYPQLLISLNHPQRDLKKWQFETLATEVLAFSVSGQTTPLQSAGQVQILRVSDQYVEGKFSGELVHPQTGKTYSIRGEFKAVLKMNI